MKHICAPFQATVLLVILAVSSHPLWADPSDTLLSASSPFAQGAPAINSGPMLQTDSPLVQAAPATTSNATHRWAGRILAGVESGFMGGIVPLAALLLFARGIWLAIPRRRLETEGDATDRPASMILPGLKSGLLGGKVFLAALLVLGRAIWLWLTTPQIKTEIVEEEPPVDVPPLRPIPQRITVF